jgi:hypothetical protein
METHEFVFCTYKYFTLWWSKHLIISSQKTAVLLFKQCYRLELVATVLFSYDHSLYLNLITISSQSYFLWKNCTRILWTDIVIVGTCTNCILSWSVCLLYVTPICKDYTLHSTTVVIVLIYGQHTIQMLNLQQHTKYTLKSTSELKC